LTYNATLISSNNDTFTSHYGGTIDILTVKTDLKGNLIWAKNFGGSKDENSNNVSPSFSGGLIVGGFTDFDDYDVSLNIGNGDIWFFELDKDGDKKWEKTFGGLAGDLFQSVKQTKDQNYIFGGSTASNDGDVKINNRLWDYWLVKIDPLGNILWEKTFGSSGYETLSDMQVTPDGGYILAGRNDNKDICIVKTDENGNI